MAGKKRRRRRAQSGRSAAAGSKARQAPPKGQVRQHPDQAASALPAPSATDPERATRTDAAPRSTTPRSRRLGTFATVLLPGRSFFAMGRPVPGLVCYALQATLLGWLPAALWAVCAKGRVARKQRGLAARLRPL